VGWQAWDIANKLITQSTDSFPIALALSLSDALGYEPQAMAELLPEIALGVALAKRNGDPS
jgi:hypothetical protein